MGHIKEKLVEMELENGDECHVEIVRDDLVHLHFGNSRLDLSFSETRELISVINEAADELKSYKE